MARKTTHCKDCGAVRGSVPWPTRPDGSLSGALCNSCTAALHSLLRKTTRKESCKASNQKRVNTPEKRRARSIASAKSNQDRRANDSLFLACTRIRSLIGVSLRTGNWSKTAKTQEILGCSFVELLQHLNCTDGIPEGFAIDHIIPMAVAYDEASAIRLNHYTNLQLLTTEANLAKSDWYTFPSGERVRARDLTLEQKKTIIKGLPCLK